MVTQSSLVILRVSNVVWTVGRNCRFSGAAQHSRNFEMTRLIFFFASFVFLSFFLGWQVLRPQLRPPCPAAALPTNNPWEPVADWQCDPHLAERGNRTNPLRQLPPSHSSEPRSTEVSRWEFAKYTSVPCSGFWDRPHQPRGQEGPVATASIAASKQATPPQLSPLHTTHQLCGSGIQVPVRSALDRIPAPVTNTPWAPSQY
ncbi:hypothetical protein V8F06_004527 [Rhypophila decipiens]